MHATTDRHHGHIKYSNIWNWKHKGFIKLDVDFNSGVKWTPCYIVYKRYIISHSICTVFCFAGLHNHVSVDYNDVLIQSLGCCFTGTGALMQSLGLYSLSARTSYRRISWSLEAERFGFRLPIALKFDRHLGSSAAEMPVKLQRDTIIITSNLVASRLHEIWQ